MIVMCLVLVRSDHRRPSCSSEDEPSEFLPSRRRFKFSPDVLFVSSGLLVRGDSALLHPHHPVGHQMEIFLSHNRTLFILRACP